MDVPELVAIGRRYVTDEAKSELLTDTFFRRLPLPEGRDPDRAVRGRVRHDIRWPSFMKNEVERAIFRSSPDKAPGPDEISFRVWRELWPVVSDHILRLYNTSLELQHTSCQWQTVRIVTLRKPGKAGYTIPKAFHSISLLPTTSK
jgi:hypothetical protein